MKNNNPILKYILISFGFISLFLGIIGIVVPLLPTTPFVLLAAFLFCKSSDKYHKWIYENKVFGKYLKDYKEGLGISLRLKAFVISLLYITILYSVFFVVNNLWLKLLLIVIAVAVSVHLFMIKTRKD